MTSTIDKRPLPERIMELVRAGTPDGEGRVIIRLPWTTPMSAVVAARKVIADHGLTSVSDTGLLRLIVSTRSAESPN